MIQTHGCRSLFAREHTVMVLAAKAPASPAWRPCPTCSPGPPTLAGVVGRSRQGLLGLHAMTDDDGTPALTAAKG